jgi:NDP-sugar pyrophosphorylase family protein
MKNAVMLDGAKAGHFAYLGDSVLGREVNLGAGTKLANLKMVNRPYTIKAGEETHRVTRRKFGAIIGDRTETGCNTVTNPGTILGPRCLVAPCQAVPPGYHPPRSVIR